MDILQKHRNHLEQLLWLLCNYPLFFGGAYFVIEENFVTNLSPLTWANTAVMKIIYANDVGAALPVICLNLGISALFLLIAIIALRRRRGYSMKDILWLIQKRYLYF